MNESRSRWVREQLNDKGAATGPSPVETAVLREVLEAQRSLDFGTIQLTIQDSRVVQIDTTRRRRL